MTKKYKIQTDEMIEILGVLVISALDAL